MRLGLTSLKRRFRRPTVAATIGPFAAPPAGRPTLQELARDLGDGAVCPPALLAALEAEIAARRRRADTAAEPDSPCCSELTVRRAELPDWWVEGDNLLLAGPHARIPDLRQNPFKTPVRGVVLAIGANVVFDHINLGGDGSLVVIGDGVYGLVGALSCLDGSTVLVGEHTTATNWAMLDACNGGIIVTGADGMWAHGVSIMTDDTHAIRDVASGRRLNTFGGRILIDRHVWLGESCRVLGGARIGPDVVVGAGALVKNVEIAANSVCVGVPARVVRSGVTWSREDAP